MLLAVVQSTTFAADVTGDRLNIGTGHGLVGSWATIAGGGNNTNQGYLSVISGGQLNRIDATNATDNGSLYCTIGGGYSNLISSNSYRSTIGGGASNLIADDANRSTIAGGDSNIIEHDAYASVIGGGLQNVILRASPYATIAGGGNNLILTNSDYSTICGGWSNTIGSWSPYGMRAFIGGGSRNIIEATNSMCVITGGESNYIYRGSAASIIGGGHFNTIKEDSFRATISGGAYNTNGGTHDTISGGLYNSTAGDSSTVVGGSYNKAAGINSLAAGYRAKANHNGAFVWADTQNADFASSAADQVSFRCNGGVTFTSSAGGGNQTVSWAPGSGSWSFTSDREAKEGFRQVDTQEILQKVAGLPITEWNYKGYPQRHVGPMAQDFHAAFRLNESTTTLNDADLHGVALAAIQALNQRVREKEQRVSELEKSVADLKQLVFELSAQQRQQ